MKQRRHALPRLLTAKALAEATTIPRSTIYDLVHRGELPAIRVGKDGIRIPEEDFMRWYSSRREVAR